jgi:hypothetical protein
MTNWRLGGDPIVAVKTPPPVSSVRRSPRYGMNARSRPLIASGIQALIGEPPFEVRNWMLPLELTYALEYGAPYTGTENGSDTSDVQSSQWFPMSVVPGTIDWPVCVFVV